jgi:TRAP-type mannitol/chloroaromatic compound transport system permease small subunit
MMGTFEKIVGVVEKLSEWTGKAGSWLCAALMISIAYEVVMRYGFRAPTLWSFDISYMLGGSLFVLGLAWVLRDDGNVRVDIISSRFSPKTQLWINLLFTAILFFPMTAYLFYTSMLQTIRSWRILEKASYTVWYPPLYPMRTLVSIALLLWLIQGVAGFYRNLKKLSGGKE